jgi:hypothetical protein
MNNHRFTLIASIVTIVSLSSFSFASTYTETFEYLSGGGSSSINGAAFIPGFSFNYYDVTPRSLIDSSHVFPGIGSSHALNVDGSVNDWLQFDGGVIPLAGGNIIQFAFPIKVLSLGSDAASSSVDILTLDQIAGNYSPYFNIRASQGVFRTTDENGWPGASSPISNDAFNPASSNNWRDADEGRWHLLVFRIYPSTSASGHYVVYDINPVNGYPTLLQNYTGGSNPEAPSAISRFCAGLCIDGVAVSDTNTRIVMDDITFWDNSFATDKDFLSAVATKYNVSLTPVELSDFNAE